MDNEKLFTLIKSPIITEQTAQLSENLKQVVFKVDLSSVSYTHLTLPTNREV